MGETRVDLEHLLEDVRDAYIFSYEETILTEIIANSLDSGVRRIIITVGLEQKTLTAVNDGSSMRRAEMLAISRHRGQHQHPRTWNGVCRRGHQARLAGVRRSHHRNQPREDPYCHR
jgi:hypothetical protein